MHPRERCGSPCPAVADRIWTASLASLILGTALAFGGAVWWARPAIAALTVLFVLAGLLRLAVEGRSGC